MTTRDPLAVLLYRLAMDEIPLGKLERLTWGAVEAAASGRVVDRFENHKLAEWAVNKAADLRTGLNAGVPVNPPEDVLERERLQGHECCPAAEETLWRHPWASGWRMTLPRRDRFRGVDLPDEFQGRRYVIVVHHCPFCGTSLDRP